MSAVDRSGLGRAIKAALGSLLLGSVSVGAAIANATPASAATTAPSYSATGVCVGGAPEFSFSFTGFPLGQNTAVNLLLDDSPDTTGSRRPPSARAVPLPCCGTPRRRTLDRGCMS